METNELIELFEYAISAKNPEKVDNAVITSRTFDSPEETVPYLCKLLEYPWHYDHEDIVLELQRIGDVRSIEVLNKTALRKFDYLDYDDSKALARKCTWALADIGTKEAKEALLELTKNPDEEIAEYARKRIDNWENELKRKKHCC